MSCSRTQHGGGRSRTPDLSLRSPTLYHWATALPLMWSTQDLLEYIQKWVLSTYSSTSVLSTYSSTDPQYLLHAWFAGGTTRCLETNVLWIRKNFSSLVRKAHSSESKQSNKSSFFKTDLLFHKDPIKNIDRTSVKLMSHLQKMTKLTKWKSYKN